eukprot:gene43316-58662_t
MFSLLALVPLVLFHHLRTPRAARPGPQLSALRSQLLPAALTFTLLALPWLAYQRLYEPPGNRLLKWHLAGAVAPDTRSVTTAVIENYRAQGWTTTLATRAENLRILFLGEWQHLLTTGDPAAIFGRRSEETFHTFRSPALWLLGAAALPLLLYARYRRRPSSVSDSQLSALSSQLSVPFPRH